MNIDLPEKRAGNSYALLPSGCALGPSVVPGQCGAKGNKELWNTSADDHAFQESLTVKSCPKTIVAATPKRFGRLFPESEFVEPVCENLQSTED